MKKQDYYIGLDIGTDSIGWAVTDTNYNMLKANGKAMWGIHLFDSGKTAEERRMFRTSRRRTDRANQRLDLLNELFAEEISKVDPEFFLRLKESKFFYEDKKLDSKYTLFNDNNYTDIDYHKEFPTIYHLRSELIHNPEKHDIRLVYLAVAHIIKKRGHFLFEGQDIGASTSFDNVFESLKQALNDYEIDFSLEDASALENLLKDKKITVKDKKTLLKNLFGAINDNTKAVCELLAGGTVELAKLFSDESLAETEIPKVTFKIGFEDKVDALATVLDDRMFLLETIKAVYDWAVLTDILNDAEYISDAKVLSYEKHKKDLKILKELVKKYSPTSYKKIFSENKNKNVPNYVAYSGHVSGTKKYAEKYSCSQEDFCKFILKELGAINPENEKEEYIKRELENGTALPKQVTKDNSVIPYQLNKVELDVILTNAAKYYDFLNKTSDGKTVMEKIGLILTFKIPYYVGPLNEHSENAWIVRKEPGKIYPWNFEDKVDKIESASKFIERMTNQCTYLVGESVLPKESIIYSKFAIYNQLNNVRVDGEKLPVDVKNRLFKDLYLNVEKAKKVTNKGLISYLYSQGVCEKNSEITGIDSGIEGTMKSYINFKNIFGENFDIDVAEDIIYKATILGESKDLLAWYLKKDHKELTEVQMKQILRLTFKSWGRFSRKLLTEIYHTNRATGECISIISGLENTQCNFMQLLSSEFDFAEEVEKFNAGKNGIDGRITYDNIESLYVSPAVKRSIWRTTLIVKEIVKIAGCNPRKIFIEMARDNTGDKKGQRTVSRKNQLLYCYNQSKADCAELSKELDKYDDNQLRSDKLFLYYAQLGRSMYTGKPIDLENLLSANSNYDIDHIYPQSKTKDDSLDNRVLVEKVKNAEKTDKYPLPSSFRTSETVALWKQLLSLNLISKEKYNRLMRTEGFSNNELSGFISRQIVETRQSTKAVADLLNKAYENTKIVYVKAGNVSDFRQKYNIVKCRAVNDYHHAKDAYLNIVVGNVYDTKFTSNPVNFINEGNVYSLNRMYDFDVKRGNTVAWLKDSTIITVKKNVMKNNILFTRYATEQKGGFYDQMIVGHGGGQMPIKTTDKRLSDFEKYGGYNKVSGAYFALVRHTNEKGKVVKTIESVPIYVASKVRKDSDELQKYFDSYLNDADILVKKILFNSVIEIDGFRMHISARSNKDIVCKCAEQLIVDDKSYTYFKAVIKFNENRKANKNIRVSPLSKITKEGNSYCFDLLYNKLVNSIYSKKLSSQIAVFENGREKFVNLSLEDQCAFLANALVLFSCVAGTTDLSLIGGASQAGQYKFSGNITKTNNIFLINQSVTGIFENRIDLAAL